MLLALYLSDKLEKPVILASYDLVALNNEIVDAVNANEHKRFTDIMELRTGECEENAEFAVDFFNLDERDLLVAEITHSSDELSTVVKAQPM